VTTAPGVATSPLQSIRTEAVSSAKTIKGMMRVLAIDEVPVMSVLPRFLCQLRDTELHAIEQGFRPSREAWDRDPPTSAPLAVP
jgi:hypothetical protein